MHLESPAEVKGDVAQLSRPVGITGVAGQGSVSFRQPHVIVVGVVAGRIARIQSAAIHTMKCIAAGKLARNILNRGGEGRRACSGSAEKSETGQRDQE